MSPDRNTMSRAVFALYGLSLVAHLGLSLGLSSIKKPEKREVTAITMAESPKPKRADPKPPPPAAPTEPKAAPERRVSQQRAKAAPATAKPGAPPPSQGASNNAATGGDGPPDFGLSLSGGGGLAVPAGGTGGGGEAAPAASSKAVQPQPQQQRKPEDCDEALVKPRPQSMPQGSYNDRAREARVEGKVRVEVQVDERGKVTSARVLGGLGHGLDESALSAAKQWTFAAGTKCGKPVAAPFVIGMRFVIGS